MGSCGLPRDVGNLACCAIFKPDEDIVELIRVSFDVGMVIKASQEFGDLPDEVSECLYRTTTRIDGRSNI